MADESTDITTEATTEDAETGADDAVINEIMDRHFGAETDGGDDEVDPPASPSPEDGGDDDDEPEGGTSTTEDEGGGDTAGDETDTDRARRVLRRDNVPESVIQGLLEGDQDTLDAWVKGAAKRQSDADAAFGRLRELEEPNAGTSPQDNKETSDDASQADTNADTATDISPNLSEVRAEIVEMFGEEEAGAVERLATAVVQPLVDRLEAQLADTAQRAGASEEVVLEMAQMSLIEEFPGLADAANQEAVRTRIQTLLKADLAHYQAAGNTPLSRARAVMKDAAFDVFRNETRARTQADTKAENARRNRSQPTASTRPTKKAAKPQTELDRQVMFTRLREEGMSIDDAMAEAGLPRRRS